MGVSLTRIPTVGFFGASNPRKNRPFCDLGVAVDNRIHDSSPESLLNVFLALFLEGVRLVRLCFSNSFVSISLFSLT